MHVDLLKLFQSQISPTLIDGIQTILKNLLQAMVSKFKKSYPQQTFLIKNNKNFKFQNDIYGWFRLSVSETGKLFVGSEMVSLSKLFK